MSDRKRAWAYFARLLLPEMRTEQKLLEWIRDEEIDSVIAYLENWGESEQKELDEFRASLDREARFFRADGSFTNAGWDKYHSTSTYEQQRLDDIQEKLGYRTARVRWIPRLVRYARETAEGTLDIAEADEAYRQLTSRPRAQRSPRDRRGSSQ